MKTYKETPVPATTRKDFVSVTCDLCKRVSKFPNFKESNFDALEIEVKMRTGNSYPEGGSGEEVSFDICPECFQKKLMPFLQAQGAEPTQTEWDW
jgi:hypothetical protein